MLSPFAEAIASEREIACSAVSDFAATKSNPELFVRHGVAVPSVFLAPS